MTADTITAIKKALEGVTPDRLRYEADAMYAAVQGEEYGDTFHSFNWADKPHRVLYDAINLIRDSASEIDRLQRENAELRNDKEHVTAEKAGIAKNAHSNVDYWKSQYEAAEAKVKRYREALHMISAGHGSPIALANHTLQSQALASTGGEHHGN